MRIFIVIVFLCTSSSMLVAQNVFELSRTNDTLAMHSLLKKQPTLVNSTNNNGYSPLLLAAYNEQPLMVTCLLNNGANPSFQNDRGSILHGVAYKGSVEIASLLLNRNIDVNAADNNGTTPLIYAVMFSHNDLAKLLVKNGANPLKKDNEGKNALQYAQTLKNTELIDFFKTTNTN